LKRDTIEAAPKIATRVASQRVLDVLTGRLPELVSGSADLTDSNNTKGAGQNLVSAADYSGGYIHYGVREHAMAAAMNGLALHGGVIPYGGTFLVFSDYCRPALRLSALMGQRVIYVMTHDSIGLGEDGPTHQPVEHLAALRAMPNLLVMRPADAVETAECWELALDRNTGPSVLARGLARSVASLARNLVDAIPTEAVSCCSSTTRDLSSRAICTGGPNVRVTPLTSRNASSSDSGSTNGVTVRRIAITSWDTSLYS